MLASEEAFNELSAYLLILFWSSRLFSCNCASKASRYHFSRIIPRHSDWVPDFQEAHIRAFILISFRDSKSNYPENLTDSWPPYHHYYRCTKRIFVTANRSFSAVNGLLCNVSGNLSHCTTKHPCLLLETTVMFKYPGCYWTIPFTFLERRCFHSSWKGIWLKNYSK